MVGLPVILYDDSRIGPILGRNRTVAVHRSIRACGDVRAVHPARPDAFGPALVVTRL